MNLIKIEVYTYIPARSIWIMNKYDMMTTPTNYIQTYYDEVYGNTDKRMHFILMKLSTLNIVRVVLGKYSKSSNRVN